MRITAITPKQKARLEEWADKWIRIGLSTEPADFEKAEKAALKAYALCNLEPPKVILRMGSPYGATVGGAIALLMLRGTSSVADLSIDRHFCRQVRQQVRQQVEQQVRQQVEQQVEQQVDQQVMLRVSGQVWEQIQNQVKQQVERTVWQAKRQVWQQVKRQVEQQVERQISLQIDQRAVLSTIMKGLNNDLGGSFWTSWCAYVTFLRDVLGWKDPSLVRFTIDEDLATSCGWVWWHQDVLAIGDRPSEIHLDAEGRLHNESGPSIAYRDGWKLYHIHGVAFPDFVIEHPNKITVSYIEKEWNADVRFILISRMGFERFIRESGLKPIHSDDFGTLYRIEIPFDEALVVVKVANPTPNPDGSRKGYFLRVPPTMRRAREAVAWTFGMSEKEYQPSTET